MSRLNKQRQEEARRKRNRSRPGLELLEHRVTPTTFHVNSLLDTVAVNLKTGKDASGHISLRSAIEAANAKPNADTIILPAGTITLTILGVGENNDATGDLDIRGSVTIKGKGAGQTIVDGNNLDRVFAIFSGKVSMSGLTIQHGHALVAGGGILNDGGKVTLTSVDLENNVAVGFNDGNGVNGSGGGAVGNPGGAGVEGTVAEGGAIMNGAGSLTIKNGFISTNQALGGSGGNGGNGGFGGGAAGAAGADGQPGTGGNGGTGGAGASALGGGIYNDTGASLTLTNTLFFSNVASGGSGGGGGSGNIGAGGAGGTSQTQAGGSGGLGRGGSGGTGGAGGAANGGGLYNLGKVTLSGTASGFQSNQAVGGAGGVGGSGDNGAGFLGGNGTAGGTGGEAVGGAGGGGGRAGDGFGGGIFNGSGGSIAGPSILMFGNTAEGNLGGAGGAGGFGNGGAGGTGSSNQGSGGGLGGAGLGGNSGAGGIGGLGEGGGIFNSAGATLSLTALKNSKTQPTSTFGSNVATGGGGGSGGIAGSGFAGNGGSGGNVATGGEGGEGDAGSGAGGGAANLGAGGGLYDAGIATFTGVTVNFTNNQVRGGFGGNGGNGRDAKAGNGGNGLTGGAGGHTLGGDGGDGGDSGIGEGGGIAVDVAGTLSINPEKGAKKGSKQAKATDQITGNLAFDSGAGAPGRASSVEVGLGGSPGGANGPVLTGQNGTVDPFTVGVGGGIATFGNTTIDNTTITGNTASTNDNNVDGTINS